MLLVLFATICGLLICGLSILLVLSKGHYYHKGFTEGKQSLTEGVRAEVAALSAKRDELMIELGRLSPLQVRLNEQAACQREIERIEREIADARKNLDGLTADIASRQDQAASSPIFDTTSYRTRISNLLNQKLDLEAKIADLVAQLNAARLKLRQHADETAKLRQQLASGNN